MVELLIGPQTHLSAHHLTILCEGLLVPGEWVRMQGVCGDWGVFVGSVNGCVCGVCEWVCLWGVFLGWVNGCVCGLGWGVWGGLWGV